MRGGERGEEQTCVVHVDDEQKTDRGKLGNTPIIHRLELAGAGWRWTPTQTCQLTAQTGVEEQNILSQSLLFRRLMTITIEIIFQFLKIPTPT